MLRFNARTYKATGSVAVHGLPVARLDLKTHQLRVFELAGDASLTEDYEIYPLAAAGSLWVRIADDTIDRIDPTSGKVTATYPGDPQSAGMLTYGFGSLWVANVQAGTVWRESVH